jgi:hypothetical protein
VARGDQILTMRHTLPSLNLFTTRYQLVLLAYLLRFGATEFGVAEGGARHFTLVFNAFVFCQASNIQ